MRYVIGTRGSKLAVTQAEFVRKRLADNYPEHEFVIETISTKGDQILDRPISQMGDRGVFVKEIEELILSGEVHIGVHSMKDMPSDPERGLCFSKLWKREDPRDVLVFREAQSLEQLRLGAVIATGSKRREYQIKQLRPDIQVVGIRGNVDTRLRKMEEEKLDGVILAAAGLHRLGMKDRISQYLNPEQMIPAPAQGTLALEMRDDNSELRQMLDELCDEDTNQEVSAERQFLKRIGGDCHLPIGAYCKKESEGNYTMRVLYGDEGGERVVSASVCAENMEELVDQALKTIRKRMKGKVTLVGGGPGDPGLITVKGREALRRADCIIYDRLVSPLLLGEAKAECEKIYVGKENHHHTIKQDEINQLLIKKATQYSEVVRLKGGDPYVFGRGGEEALALVREGIPVQVIPGISSCIAGPAYAGIPITHRGVASGFHVMTAHSQKDRLADLDFDALAKGKDTCVFLMGRSKIQEITNGLMGAGMSPDTMAAVISCATRPDQRVCVSPLHSIADRVEAENICAPALIIVGDVVKLRDQLKNCGQPRTKRYLVPKIGENTSMICRILTEHGIYVKEVQVGRIVPCELSFEREHLERTDWFIFTSRQGVLAFWNGILNSGFDARVLAKSQIAAVGERTAQCLLECGIRADFIADVANGERLARQLLEQIDKEQNVCYVKAKQTNSAIRQILSSHCHLEEKIVYENVAVLDEQEMICGDEEYSGVIVTCASSAERLAVLFGHKWTQCAERYCFYSMGPKTTEVLRNLGVRHILETEDATYESLAKLVMKNGESHGSTI